MLFSINTLFDEQKPTLATREKTDENKLTVCKNYCLFLLQQSIQQASKSNKIALDVCERCW